MGRSCDHIWKLIRFLEQLISVYCTLAQENVLNSFTAFALQEIHYIPMGYCLKRYYKYPYQGIQIF